jgi:predicted transcriptional regulator
LESTVEAVIEVAKQGSAVRTARSQFAAAREGKAPDDLLSVESARSLFAELTPARAELLDTLRKVGPCNVYALAKSAGRNYANVHTGGVGRLEKVGLIERRDEDAVFVPYESVEILPPLAQVAQVRSAPHKLRPYGMACRRVQLLTRTLAARPAFRSAANL